MTLSNGQCVGQDQAHDWNPHVHHCRSCCWRFLLLILLLDGMSLCECCGHKRYTTAFILRSSLSRGCHKYQIKILVNLHNFTYSKFHRWCIMQKNTNGERGRIKMQNSTNGEAELNRVQVYLTLWIEMNSCKTSTRS